MKKILHFFGLETREEIMEFKQRRAAKHFLMMLKRITELENRVKQLEDETI
jgi:tRNA A37 threonylcarbamoyladenosine synthetase subunit TsaC/SUA5/YrdC